MKNIHRKKIPHFQTGHFTAFSDWRWQTVNRRGLSMFRRITEVWESDGESEHRQIFGPDNSISLIESSRCISHANFEKAQKDIEQLMDSGVRKIEDVRTMLLND